MTDEDFWAELKRHKKEKFDADRRAFLSKAASDDDGGWTKHTEYHWSRMINGERLDYWPSRKKFQWRGKVRRGDVMKIVRAAAAIPPKPNASRRQVRSWMRNNADEFDTATQLAEAANAALDLPPGAMDDETHWVWEEAILALEWAESA